MTPREISDWLKETSESSAAALWESADYVREAFLGGGVHFYAVIEVSNICENDCLYCEWREKNRALARYRLGVDEILQCAAIADRLGYGSIVLEAGFSNDSLIEVLTEAITRIKAAYPLSITIQAGQHSLKTYEQWKRAGADRCIINFETADRTLFRILHPQKKHLSERLSLLAALRAMGYEIGSGIMVGLPGQTLAGLEADLLTFVELNLDLILIEPFVSPIAPVNPHGRESIDWGAEFTVLKMIALARILCPTANINAGSSRSPMLLHPLERALNCGANVVMPNLTPTAVHDDTHQQTMPFDRSVDLRIRDMMRYLGRVPANNRGRRRRTGGDGPGLFSFNL